MLLNGNGIGQSNQIPRNAKHLSKTIGSTGVMLSVRNLMQNLFGPTQICQPCRPKHQLLPAIEAFG